MLVLFNLPFIIANLARHGSIDNWRYSYAFHVERELSIDTLLGVWSIWLGYPAIEVYAGYITLVLMAFVLFFRPSLPLAHKGAALCMTALLFNRVYSPQFHLWFIPFLIIAIASEPRARALIITALLVLLEVFNITIFPFLFVHLMDNSWGLVSKTNPFTAIASLLVVGRGMVLFVLICLLLAKKEPEHARGACGGGDLGHGTHAADRGAGP